MTVTSVFCIEVVTVYDGWDHTISAEHTREVPKRSG